MSLKNVLAVKACLAAGPAYEYATIRYPKRLIDILFSTLALSIMLPVLCLIAVAIKVNSPGPVLFIQLRRGLGGCPFRFYKFRTMFKECEDKLCREQSKRHDVRITRVGSFLRRYSLDEVPQLFNVLRGDMSLIGPRPHALGTNIGGVGLPAISGEYLHRYVVKPGITGWAQVTGYRGILMEPADLHARLERDFHYIRNRSLLLDFRILLLTFVGVFRNANAF